MVPSAPGKRFSADTKVTDLLYACYDKAEAGEDFSDILTEIKSRFYEIIKGNIVSACRIVLDPCSSFIISNRKLAVDGQIIRPPDRPRSSL